MIGFVLLKAPHLRGREARRTTMSECRQIATIGTVWGGSGTAPET